MPNWCNCEIYIDGNVNDIERFLAQAAGENENGENEKFSFSRFLPTPPEMLANPNDDGNSWHNWRVENWGTKWEPDNVSVSRPTNSVISIHCLTAWSPPHKFLENVSKQYPALVFECEYAEPGMCFAGFIRAKDGSVSDEDYSEERREELFRGLGYLNDDDEDDMVEVGRGST
jgi:hypothetical protein